MRITLNLDIEVDENKWADDHKLNTEKLVARFVVPEDVKAAFVIALRNQFMLPDGAIDSIRRLD